MKKLLLFVLPVLIALPLVAAAQGYGLPAAANNTGLSSVPVEVLAANIIRVILGFVGIIFLVLVIYAGFLWMVGGRDGNEEAISKAKSLLTNATIGLLVITAAYSITYYIADYIIKANAPAPNLQENVSVPPREDFGPQP
jgi:heme/copper-type cytochrome/quinol oxidase subunit 2